MRLDDLTPEHIRRAIDLYDSLAWPPGETGTRRVDLAPLLRATTLEEALEAFERGDPGDDPTSRRFTLRIGNSRYPFMKFVLQEPLVANEFFFTVDTHDNLDVRPGSPDYERWEALKRFNRELKGRIEAAWREAGLPTHADLVELLAGIAENEREKSKRRRILLVDDERDVARGLEILLSARGYDVDLAHDGRAALDRLARDPLPDLVLLDYEMPEFDGQEVLRRMRADPHLADVPVLMATASAIDLGDLERVSGLLHKPYPRGLLFALLRRILGRRGAGAGSGDGSDGEETRA